MRKLALMTLFAAIAPAVLSALLVTALAATI